MYENIMSSRQGNAAFAMLISKAEKDTSFENWMFRTFNYYICFGKFVYFLSCYLWLIFKVRKSWYIVLEIFS